MLSASQCIVPEHPIFGRAKISVTPADKVHLIMKMAKTGYAAMDTTANFDNRLDMAEAVFEVIANIAFQLLDEVPDNMTPVKKGGAA